MTGQRRVRTVRPLVGVGLFLVVLVAPRALGLRVNATVSMERGLYREVDGEPRVGDVVAACVPAFAARLARERGYLGGGACPGGARPVVKTVAALGGATLLPTGEGIEVDGRLLPASRSLPVDSAGRPLEPFLRVAVRLADGEVWLHSSRHPRSWDSRYFGPVRREAVVSVVRPVWTFE